MAACDVKSTPSTKTRTRLVSIPEVISFKFPDMAGVAVAKRLPSAPPTLPGLTYVRPLGSGGFADVFLYEQDMPRRNVAVKVLSSEMARVPEIIVRFQREAAAFTRLNHPNVVRFIEVVAEEGRSCLVVEYVPGSTLAILIRSGKVASFAQKLELSVQVCRGVAEIHAHDLIHRDLKPENILVTEAGVAKITDFGLVRNAEDTAITMQGQLLGTPYYMAPEQELGVYSTGVDIYALGVCLY